MCDSVRQKLGHTNDTIDQIVFVLFFFCFSRLIRSSTYGKQKISDFPPCGKGKRKGESSVQWNITVYKQA